MSHPYGKIWLRHPRWVPQQQPFTWNVHLLWYLRRIHGSCIPSIPKPTATYAQQIVIVFMLLSFWLPLDDCVFVSLSGYMLSQINKNWIGEKIIYMKKECRLNSTSGWHIWEDRMPAHLISCPDVCTVAHIITSSVYHINITFIFTIKNTKLIPNFIFTKESTLITSSLSHPKLPCMAELGTYQPLLFNSKPRSAHTVVEDMNKFVGSMLE